VSADVIKFVQAVDPEALLAWLTARLPTMKELVLGIVTKEGKVEVGWTNGDPFKVAAAARMLQVTVDDQVFRD